MLSKKEIVKFWKDGAKDDIITAQTLVDNKRYSACLFFVHIFLEKTLKALVIERSDKAAPFTHDLLILVKESGINLNQEQKELLRVINTFNIRARYDDYKLQFHKRATKSYTGEYFKLANELYLWLQKSFTTKEN